MNWFIASSALVLVIAAAIMDLRTREISDWIPASLFLLAIVAKAFDWTESTWIDLLLGCLLGFVAPCLLYSVGAMGGGDVKVLAAVGALLGPWGMMHAFVWIGLAGGLLAIVSLVRRQREYAYVPAIAAGLLAHFFGSGVLDAQQAFAMIQAGLT